MIDAATSRRVLEDHGAVGEVVTELLDYTRPHFGTPDLAPDPFPLADEPCVAVWEEYAEDARRSGTVEVLRRSLVQLRFPIAAGMKEDPAYRGSTRRGDPVPEDTPTPAFARPEGVSISIHGTPAGRIPIVVAEERADFVLLVRALTLRNEPIPVPAAQGACIVAGYNNWDRIARIRRRWERENPSATPSGWDAEFKRLVPEKARYQDRFILLSGGPYSNVSAAALGLSEERWRRHSLAIRREHECTHYFTRRVLGSMKNTLHDELIADYVGLSLAMGSYRPQWLLHFLGLESFPHFREDGRLARYRGDPPLSDKGFRVLQSLVRSAARGLERIDPLWKAPRTDGAVARAILELTGRSVLELAALGSAAESRGHTVRHVAESGSQACAVSGR